MKRKKTTKAEPPKGLPMDHDDVLEYIEAKGTSVFTFKSLYRELKLATREEKMELAALLQNMVRNNTVIALPDASFQAATAQQFVTGTLQYVNPNFAFLISSESEQDVRIEADFLIQAFDGDTVKARLWPSMRDGKPLGEVVEIIQRKRDRFVGRIEVMRGFGYLIPDNKRTWVDIFIPGPQLNGAENNDKVVVEVYDWGGPNRNPVGKVVELLGAAGSNETEMHAILAEFGLPWNFPEAVENESKALPDEIPASEIAKRKDFRKVTTFTIDPIDAKDFDDAISVKDLGKGLWEIGVHIADVSHFVTEGTELDKEALQRGTSVYLVDRVVPMLPERLSNNLCSLVPNKDRLTFAAVFVMNEKAEIQSEWFGRTIIHSDRRFSYEQAQEILEGAEGDFKSELLLLNQLAHILKNERFANGAIGFETPEVKFVLDDRGTPLGISPKIRKDAHKLIEEFMLLANRQVARFMHNQRKGKEKNTVVFRVHEPPQEERIKIFSAFARKFGYRLSLEGDELAESLNHLIESVQGKPEEDLLQNLALRTMSKARYTTEPIGHFGLAFDHYSHFTSPIRRYPDLMVHRLLQHYLDKGEPVDRDVWEPMCKQSSERERVASEAERASIKYKQVEFMALQKQGKVWEGIVSGVTEWGFYVEIVSTKCEGLVRISDLRDDHYELDSDNYRLVGVRTKRIIAFGDRVEVKVKKTNLEKRQMDLMLVDEDLERYSAMRLRKPKR